jgi:hypothetical protein
LWTILSRVYLYPTLIHAFQVAKRENLPTLIQRKISQNIFSSFHEIKVEKKCRNLDS